MRITTATIALLLIISISGSLCLAYEVDCSVETYVKTTQSGTDKSSYVDCCYSAKDNSIIVCEGASGDGLQAFESRQVYDSCVRCAKAGTVTPTVTCTPGVESGARFSSLSGQVEIRCDSDPKSWEFAKMNTVLQVDDHVKTGEDSSAIIGFADMSTYLLKSESEIIITKPPEKITATRLVLGNIWVNVKKMMKGGTMEIDMGQAVAGIKGTTLVCEETGTTSVLKVIDGTVSFMSKKTGAVVQVPAGQMVTATANGLGPITSFDITAEAIKYGVDPAHLNQDPAAGTTTTAAPSGSGTTVTSPCSGSGPSIYVESRTMNPGQEVVIPIMMCNANDIANMDLSVAYDSSALQFKDAVKGSLNSNVLFESNNVGSTVKIAFAGKSGFSGSGSIAVLTFKVTGQNGASSPITVSVGSASTSGGKPVTIPVNNGKVSIGNSNPNDPGGRGKVTSLDALIALQISVGKRAADTNYDITKDGTVNSNDAREILKLAVQ
jgi:hypothetical protein